MLYAINIFFLDLQQGFLFTSSGSERSKQIMACTYVLIYHILFVHELYTFHTRNVYIIFMTMNIFSRCL